MVGNKVIDHLYPFLELDSAHREFLLLLADHALHLIRANDDVFWPSVIHLIKFSLWPYSLILVLVLLAGNDFVEYVLALLANI